jgi:serine/threonine protein phosphatase 1
MAVTDGSDEEPDFAPAPGWLPQGVRVYAIGDVHGCAGRLTALHEMIGADAARRPAAEIVVAHLGDYIDRGPDSAAVIAMLEAGPPVPGAAAVNLMGNHERTMLDALAGAPASRTDWLFNGGRAALESWGIDPDSSPDEWRRAIPPPHLAVIEGLSLSHRLGGYLFVHAGVRPGVALTDQSPADLLAIRQMFLSSDADFAPVVRPNRIGIDTGAVFGGALTCVVLEADRLAFLHA